MHGEDWSDWAGAQADPSFRSVYTRFSSDTYLVVDNSKCMPKILDFVFYIFYTEQNILSSFCYSKTCVKRPLSKRPKIGFQHQLSLIAGQKYCRMLQGEQSAILSTFVKQPNVIKTFCLFLWPFYTGFTVFLRSKYFMGYDVSIYLS